MELSTTKNILLSLHTSKTSLKLLYIILYTDMWFFCRNYETLIKVAANNAFINYLV